MINTPKLNKKRERSTSKQNNHVAKHVLKKGRMAKQEKDTSIFPWACNPRQDSPQDPAW